MTKRSFWLLSGALLIGLAAACASEDSGNGGGGGSGAYPGKGGSSGSGWGGSSGSTNCSRAGRPCQAKNDCCSGLTCRFSRCCAPSGDPCAASNECCDSDHACIDNVCTPTSSGKGGAAGSTGNGGSSAGGASGEGGTSAGGAAGSQCLAAWDTCTAGGTACCSPANCVEGMCCGDTGDGCKIDDDCCWLKDTCQGGKCTETAGTGGSSTGGSGTGGSGGACTATWENCQNTAECCSGSCNEGLCCSANGDSCASDDDCCFSNLKCSNKMCQASGTGGSGGSTSCGIYFSPCQSTFECCTGLTCKTTYCCADTNEICGVDIDCCNLTDTCKSGKCSP